MARDRSPGAELTSLGQSEIMRARRPTRRFLGLASDAGSGTTRLPIGVAPTNHASVAPIPMQA